MKEIETSNFKRQTSNSSPVDLDMRTEDVVFPLPTAVPASRRIEDRKSRIENSAKSLT
jgi:hypothetical protein